MFICEKCLKDTDNYGFSWSFGPCENCGKTRNCVEVYLAPVETESQRKERKRAEWFASAEKAHLDRAYNPCPGCGKIDAIDPCTCPKEEHA